MKFKVLLPLLLWLLSVSVFCQSWFPDGATWHHAYHSGFGTSGYVKMEAAGDTVVLGQPARKLTRTRAYIDLTTNISYTGSLSTLVAHESDGLVMVHAPALGLFDTLYHIHAAPGDHWRLPRLPHWRLCADSSYIQVMDTGTIVLGGLPLRLLIIEVRFLLDGQPTGFTVPDTIIERIGTINSYFILHDRCNGELDSHEAGNFRCYSDSLIELESSLAVTCDFITSMPDAGHTAGALRAWPNPGTDVLFIETTAGLLDEVLLRDALGRVCLHVNPHAQRTKLHAHGLPPGYYTVEVSTPQGKQVRRWLKR